MSTMIDEKVRVAFEDATIQIATSPTMVRAVAKTFVTEGAKMALMAKFIASQTC